MSTATNERRTTETRLPGELRWLLVRLRWAIRGYAWIDGLATAAIWAGVVFFALWLVDWTFEPSWPVRRAAMFVASAVLCVIVYRLILRRAFAPLPKSSLAALIERQHGEFGDRLMTAVNLCDRPVDSNDEADDSTAVERAAMLEQTVTEARTLARGVRVGRVFNARPLAMRAAGALALVVACGATWLIAHDALAFYLQRLAGSQEPWPRKTLLVVEGFWADFALVVPEANGAAADEVHVYAGAVDVRPSASKAAGQAKNIVAGSAARMGGGDAATSAEVKLRAVAEIVAPFGNEARFVAADDRSGVAVLRRTADCLWRGDARGFRPGAKLSLGRYELISGRAEIMLGAGTRFVVEGPAAFELIASTKVRLEHGKASVRAPLRPTPFTIETPRGNYVAEPVDRLKVVRGGDVTLTVLADALGTLPEFVEATYTGESGADGRQMLQQEAAAIPGRDEFQRYTLTLKNVLGSLDLDLRGGDARVSGIGIETVDSPKLVATQAACVFPKYLVDERSGRFTPRTFDIAGPLELPVGTDVTLQARASKPLERVEITVGSETKSVTPASDRHAFAFPLGRLDKSTTLFLTLHDADGVANREAIPLQLIATPDEPPRVAVRLFGVGSSVTPEAVLRLQGEIVDDNAIDRGWFAVAVAGGDPGEHALVETLAGERRVALATTAWRTGTRSAGAAALDETTSALEQSLDLAAFRLPNGKALSVGDQLMISVRATDRCDLHDKPAVGESDRVPIEVVAADDLLARLEAREVLLRDKLETVIDELEQTRDTLGELKPRDATAESSTDAASATRRTLAPQVERAIQNSERSGFEATTLANALDESGEELATNRLDTSERRERLSGKLIEPLRKIVAEGYPKFDAQLATLRTRTVAIDQIEQLRDQLAAQKDNVAAAEQTSKRIAELERALATAVPLDVLIQEAQREADAIVVALRAALTELADAGDFNQLVEELREISKRQQQLRERTRKEQQKSLLE